MALQRVETDAIQDDAVTTAKIAANAVAAADIAADAITNVKVASNAAIAVSKITGLGTAATLTAGTSANNVVQLDGSARLPAVNGANLTGVSTDTSAMENNIAILAFKTQAANNLAKFNLIDQVVDEYKDGTGFTGTNVSVTGTTAADGYLASVIAADGIDANAQLVIHSDSTHNSTSFTDSSSNNFTITPYDSVHHSTTVTKSGMGATSIFFDHGSGGASDNDRLELPDNATWDYGTGNFTWEAWVYTTDGSQVEQIVSAYAGGTTVESNSYFRLHAGGYKFILNGVVITSSTMLTNNTWHHVACERASATQMNLYLDGVKTASGTGGASYNLTTDHITIGNHRVNASGEVWKGYMTEIRLSNVARYNGSNFTPRTTPYASGSTSATGTAISTANTALSAPTTGDICMLIENYAGTATLNTDLKAYVSRNGGTGWDQATLVDKGTWGSGTKKIVSANNVAFSNSASGTDMRYKIEWANQASGTKETRVHATSLAWA